MRFAVNTLLMKLTRYWLELAVRSNQPVQGNHYGITAWTYEDALFLLKALVFKTEELPSIVNCKENVDINTLDTDHILPNMAPSNFRGVWFPLGY
jgi:hypothetical protein